MALLSLLLAGSLFFVSCAPNTVARGVTVDGVDVGGMTVSEAETFLRSRMEQTPLTVYTPNGEYEADLVYTDDLHALLTHAKKGDNLNATGKRNWIGMEENLAAICAENARDGKSAELDFSGEGFTYQAEENGVACDFKKLLSDVQNALTFGGDSVTLSVFEVPPEVTVEKLKSETQLLSSFSTRFDEKNAPRGNNIALAASRISGTVIAPQESFSFNEAVGKRTEENGFQTAKVIENGEFRDGVGGGVCQVSTTLFNAALTAGMKISESHAHSLAVSYVAPSRGAMVSSCSDLRFENPFDMPVYVLSEVKSGQICFSFYGLPSGKRYEVESVELARIAPPPPLVLEGEEGVLRREAEGIASESYLLTYEGDVLLSRTRIRRDKYAAVQGIVSKPKQADPALLP